MGSVGGWVFVVGKGEGGSPGHIAIIFHTDLVSDPNYKEKIKEKERKKGKQRTEKQRKTKERKGKQRKERKESKYHDIRT